MVCTTKYALDIKARLQRMRQNIKEAPLMQKERMMNEYFTTLELFNDHLEQRISKLEGLQNGG